MAIAKRTPKQVRTMDKVQEVFSACNSALKWVEQLFIAMPDFQLSMLSSSDKLCVKNALFHFSAYTDLEENDVAHIRQGLLAFLHHDTSLLALTWKKTNFCVRTVNIFHRIQSIAVRSADEYGSNETAIAALDLFMEIATKFEHVLTENKLDFETTVLRLSSPDERIEILNLAIGTDDLPLVQRVFSFLSAYGDDFSWNSKRYCKHIHIKGRFGFLFEDTRRRHSLSLRHEWRPWKHAAKFNRETRLGIRALYMLARIRRVIRAPKRTYHHSEEGIEIRNVVVVSHDFRYTGAGLCFLPEEIVQYMLTWLATDPFPVLWLYPREKVHIYARETREAIMAKYGV